METQEGNELDDFGDFASEKMGDSMISNKSEKNFFSEEKLASQEQLEPKSENVQEEVKVETQEGNELDDFGDFASEKMGDSLISNNSEGFG